MMNYPPGATTLDPNELAGLKHPHIETRGELDELEQQNIQEAFTWLNRQRKFKNYVSVAFLLELHRQCFGAVWSWAGHFRSTDKNIGVELLLIRTELSKLFDDTNYWIKHNTYNREQFAARFHHRLVKIHPFPNGNVRHSRIMTDILLEKELGLRPITFHIDQSWAVSKTSARY
ncbi:MAG: mobile mystery protein B [Xanthomonadales bacterium]|nr:mobile mystery protein B [Xanthomonadales bacterium]